MIWGASEFGWEDVVRTKIWVFGRATAIAQRYQDLTLPSAHLSIFFAKHDLLQKAFKGHTDAHTSFLSLLDSARALDLTNPRDRIFAFMEMAQIFGWPIHVQPNYKESQLYVYSDFAAEYARSTKNVDILNYVIHNEKTLQSPILSWVPNWDTLDRSMAALFEGSVLTSRTLSIATPIIEETTLKVTGVITDTVKYVSNILSSPKLTPKMIFDLWMTVDAAEVDSPYESSTRIDAFLDALTRPMQEEPSEKWLEVLTACRRYLLGKTIQLDATEPIISRDVAESERVAHLTACISYMVYGSEFILTQRGYFGLAPRVTREGDTCGIIFGCRTSCILRKTNTDLGWQFIGASLITGKQCFEEERRVAFRQFGTEESKDWVNWDLEEQDIELC